MKEFIDSKDPHAAVLAAQALVRGETNGIEIRPDEMEALKKLVKDLNYDPSHMGTQYLDLNNPTDFDFWLDCVRDFTEDGIEL